MELEKKRVAVGVAIEAIDTMRHPLRNNEFVRLARLTDEMGDLLTEELVDQVLTEVACLDTTEYDAIVGVWIEENLL